MENVQYETYYCHKKFDLKRKAKELEDNYNQNQDPICFNHTSLSSSHHNYSKALENSTSSKYNIENLIGVDEPQPTSRPKRIKLENSIVTEILPPVLELNNNKTSILSSFIKDEENNFIAYSSERSSCDSPLNSSESSRTSSSLNTSHLDENDSKDLLKRIYTNDVFLQISKYHPNMARAFPRKQRNEKDQERRKKNTMACRKTRRLKKLEDLVVEQNYIQLRDQHLKIIRATIKGQHYIQELLQLVDGQSFHS